jgi:hypothetical protein
MLGLQTWQCRGVSAVRKTWGRPFSQPSVFDHTLSNNCFHGRGADDGLVSLLPALTVLSLLIQVLLFFFFFFFEA